MARYLSFSIELDICALHLSDYLQTHTTDRATVYWQTLGNYQPHEPVDARLQNKVRTLPESDVKLHDIFQESEGRRVLQDIRGIENVDEEFNDICAACKQANLVVNPWRNLLRPAYRPQLVIALTATLFQQWTGINT